MVGLLKLCIEIEHCKIEHYIAFLKVIWKLPCLGIDPVICVTSCVGVMRLCVPLAGVRRRGASLTREQNMSENFTDSS